MSDGNGDNPEDAAVEEVFKGAVLRLEDLKREDGIITKGLTNAQQGILNRLLTAINKDDDYRQELKTAFFRTPEESDLAIEAINERLMCGVSIQPLVDKVIARSAGVNASRFRALLDAYSHATITTNREKPEDKKHWYNNDKSKTPFSQ